MNQARELVTSVVDGGEHGGEPAGGIVGAFASGSQFVGLGNSRSNLNVYLVGRRADGPAGIPDRGLSTSALDVERIDLDALDDGVAAVERGAPRAGDITALLAHRATRELLVRFHYAEILADPGGQLTVLKKRLAEAESALRQQLICWHTLQCVNFRDDYIGAVEAGDRDTAEANSGRILTAALQAFLAGCGEYYAGDKWTWAKLRRSGAGRDLVEAARAATFTSVPATARRRGEHKVELAQVLVSAAITKGWDAPAAAAWSAVPRAERVTLSAAWFPVRFADRLTMDTVEKAQTSISVQGVELWASSVRGGPAEVVDHVAAGLGAPRAEVARYLDTIVGHGMVSFHD